MHSSVDGECFISDLGKAKFYHYYLINSYSPCIGSLLQISDNLNYSIIKNMVLCGKILTIFSENARKEGERLEQEATNAQPYSIPDTNLQIQFEGLPTMVDGKIKSIWSGNNCCNKCYLCHSGSMGKDALLQHRRCKHFNVKNRAALRYGFSPLHVRLRALDWFLKTRTYSDFKYHEAR